MLLILPCTSESKAGGFDDTTVVVAVRTKTPPKIDGVLDDDAWKGAVPITSFTQRELQEGSPSTERTEVRIVYDDQAMYVGVWCFDREPDGIVANETKRDFPIYIEDNFRIIFDTYHDKRNGFLFGVNPNGARSDALITDEGQGVNQDWNGLWDVQTTVNSSGWFAEIEIPFSTLRFPEASEQIWGINFERDIRRKREQSLWRGYLRNYQLEKLSQAGTLIGLKDIHRDNAIEFKPYLLGGIQRTYPPLDDRGTTDQKIGLDLKYALTPMLTLDVTTNTDFAQVEADRVRINLTRFPLYFPEKRDFFLEGAGTFNFQFGDAPRPFYSRRIGLSPNRELLPILAGVRLVGKAGPYNLGILSMQTGTRAGEPTTNYTVARVKRDIFDQSYIGVIATNKQSSFSYNRLFGVDGAWVRSDVFGSNTLIVGGALSGTIDPGIHSNNLAYRIYADFPNDYVDHFLGFREVQTNFDPQLGFLDRSGYRQFSWTFSFRPRPQGLGLQYLEFKPVELDYFVNPDGSLQSMNYEGRLLGFLTKTGEAFEFNVQRNADHPTEDFEIYTGVVIPRAAYWWTQWELQYETNSSQTISFWTSYSWGEFYDGHRKRFSFTPQIRFGGHVTASLDYTRNQVHLPGGSFVTDEAAAGLDVGFSTRLNSSVFTQWNNEDREINLNFRIHWIPEIGSDVYLVYNHLFGTNSVIQTEQATILAKVTYRFVL